MSADQQQRPDDWLADPEKFNWNDEDVHFTDEDETTPVEKAQNGISAFYDDLRDLAFVLAAHRQETALDHLTKAAMALNGADVDALQSEVALAKAAVPASLVQGIVQNLFSSLAQMMQTTVDQLRGIAGAVGATGNLVPSLGIQTSANLQGWPTL